MSDFDYNSIIRDFSMTLPKTDEGRIDYSGSEFVPITTCFLRHEGKILLLRRSDVVASHPGLWETVTGVLDEVRPLEHKALKELKEQIGINRDDIEKLIEGGSFSFFDHKTNKTWIVFPIMVELTRRPEVELNWERSDQTWIKPDELKAYETVPDLDKSLGQLVKVTG
jgi:8-oxo-dGTP pyrophosphatase MutT (NUDIX family)